jgi:hypothetical protein
MNWQHLRVFLWLRWRLRINQLKRGGTLNVVILAILAVAGIAAAAVLFVVFLCIGLFALDHVSPVVLLYVWDGLVFAFLFSWATGLLTDLQRSESLSLTKFLHLPVSLSSAFLINYVSSLASVSLLLFVPAMIGLCLGLLFSRGVEMLLLLPMLAAFLLMVTALTYQFQGWLATLMANPRRRRTIIVLATMIFILLCQLPNLVNVLHPWERQTKQPPPPPPPFPVAQDQLPRAQSKNKSTQVEVQKRQEDIQKRQAEMEKRQTEIDRAYQARMQKENAERGQRMEETIRLMNLLLPPGWLPAGVEAAAAGWPLPILLAILGPTLIGSASLYRAYRTTLRLYTGQYTSGSGRTPAVRPAKAAAPSSGLLEKKLPWLSEQATAITLAAFRSLLRAPEGKMLLLTPLLFLVIFGSMVLARAGRAEYPEEVRPLLGFGAMVMVLFSMTQILGNQFGFDRNGFRVYVLSPACRRDILLGKNLAIAPVALTIAAIAAVVVQFVSPMRLDHFLALAPRFVSMYLLYCLPANVLSILAPIRIASGSFQPSRIGGIAILLQLAFMFVWPIVLAFTLIPLGIDLVVEEMGGLHRIPLDFLLSLLMCVGIIYLYGLILRLQGDWLHAREEQILQIVTTREE